MRVYITLRRDRHWSRWTRPRRWAPRRWQAFVLHCGDMEIVGATRQSYGTALLRFKVKGAEHQLLPVSDYGGLMAMQRRKVADGSGDGVLSAAALDWKPIAKLASLVAHLALTKYEDGTERTPGTMRVQTKGAMWQVSLEDPDAAAVLRINAPSFPEALQQANLLLEATDTMWEPAPWLRKEVKKKKGK